MRMHRQGDVLIATTTEIPTGCRPVPRDNGHLVLAYGEVTGHAHVVEGLAELFAPEDVTELEDRFLRVEVEVQVVHDEHAAITLPPGDYIIRQQREYMPEEIRAVAD